MSNRRRMFLTAAAILLIGPRLEASSYTITDLGTLPGTNQGVATGINNMGQVVGYDYYLNAANPGSGAVSKSFLFSNGQMTEINNPSPTNLAGNINDSGQVVGLNHFINSSGETLSSYPPVQLPVATTVNGIATTTQTMFNVFGLNDSGQILAAILSNPPGQDSVSDVGIYQNGKFLDITKVLGLAPQTIPMAINNEGSALLSAPGYGGLLYRADGTTQVINEPAVSLAMNNIGQIIGTLQSGGSFLESGGNYYPLLSLLPPSSQTNWGFLGINAINDEGQIVGYGQTSSGQQHAFLMTPNATPEPSTLALLVTTIGAFSIREWVRRGGRAEVKAVWKSVV